MRRIKTILLLMIMFILQGTLAGRLSLMGAVPDLILASAAAVTFMEKGYESMAAGTLFALLQDICYGPLVGISAVSVLLALAAAVFLRNRIYRENILAQIAAAASVTFIYHTVYWICASVFLPSGASYLQVLKILPAVILWNVLLFLVIARFFTEQRGYRP